MKIRISIAVALAMLVMLLALGCMPGYAALTGAAQRSGGDVTCCCALVSGGAMSDERMAAAQALLGEGYRLQRSADGGTSGYFAADSAFAGAWAELKLRGVFGVGAEVRRWVCGIYGAPDAGYDKACVAPGAGVSDTAALAKILLAAAGDEPCGAGYTGPDSASFRGKNYHAAVRAGAVTEFTLSEGWLLTDY